MCIRDRCKIASLCFNVVFFTFTVRYNLYVKQKWFVAILTMTWNKNENNVAGADHQKIGQLHDIRTYTVDLEMRYPEENWKANVVSQTGFTCLGVLPRPFPYRTSLLFWPFVVLPFLFRMCRWLGMPIAGLYRPVARRQSHLWITRHGQLFPWFQCSSACLGFSQLFPLISRLISMSRLLTAVSPYFKAHQHV